MDTTDFAALTGAQGTELLAELAGTGGYRDDEALALASRLRSRYPAGLVASAMTQFRLRGRAEAKFGPAAGFMFFTAAGLEQATRGSVAALRAQRFASAGVRSVADLCCGIGGDALAFAAAGIEVTAVDQDPVTCAVVAANARAAGFAELISVHCEDVRTAVSATWLDSPNPLVRACRPVRACDAVFLDPARRTARGRVFDPRAYSPPWDFALGLRELFPVGGFKAAPGLPHNALPRTIEAEWVSDRGEVKEAGVYFGPAATPGARRATLLPGAHTLATDVEEPVADPEPGPVRRYLYEPDGAVIRAGLIGALAHALDATTVDRSIAYLTADRLVATPFADAYEVCEVLPFDVKRLRGVLAERSVRTLTVKKRGADVDPAALRAQLLPRSRSGRDGAGGRRDAGGGSASSAVSAVVFITRVLGAHVALVAQPAELAR